MGDEEAKLLEAAKKLPWDERLVHANWKARVAAYEEVASIAAKAYDGSNPALQAFGNLVGKVVMDSNANAQVKALETLATYLERVGDEAYAARAASATCLNMANKCLNGRPNTIKAVESVCMLFTELEQGEAVAMELLKACGNKVPKVVIAALQTLLQIVSSFGAVVVPAKPILSKLPPVFDHKDAKVRELAKDITVELGLYIGGGIVNQLLLEKMNSDAMKADVQKKMDESGVGKGPPKKPERLTRKAEAQRAAKDAARAQAGGDAGEDAEAVLEEEEAVAPVMDTYELAEPKDVLAALSKAVVGEAGPFWKAMGDAKWSVKRDALKELQAQADTPKIASGDFGDIHRSLKKFIQNDSNVVVVGDSILAAAMLAKGLRHDFRDHARHLTALVLDKFKDKQTLVVKNCHQALYNFVLYCYAITDVMDEILAALAHKVPKVKAETCKFLEEALPALGADRVKPSLKGLMPTLVKTMDDADATVRTQALQAVAAAGRTCGGMASIGRYIENVDDRKKKGVEELVGHSRPGTAPAAASAPALAPVRAKTPAKTPKALAPRDMNTAPVQKAASASAARAGSAKPAVKKAGAAGGAAEEQENVESAALSKEQIAEAVAALMGAEVVAGLGSAVWKERLEGMEAVEAKVQELGAACDLHVDVLVALIAPIVASDKNLQVSVKAVEVVTALADASEAFSKRHVMQCLDGLATQLGGHIRARAPTSTCLHMLTEVAGPAFMLRELPKKAMKNTNPKVMQESLGWMGSCMEDFGMAGVNTKVLIDTLKEGLDHATPATRTAATKVIGVLHTFVGPKLLDFLSDLKPALLTSVEAECKKSGYDPATAAAPCKRTVRKRQAAAAASGGGGGGGGRKAAASAGAGARADDDDDEGAGGGGFGGLELPVEDVSGQITSTLLGDMGSADWKKRQAALEEVDGILKGASNRIGPDVGDLFTALKARLLDTNKNLVALAVATFGDVAAAMGLPVERQTRGLMGDILKTLSDSKKTVRDACVRSLDQWAGAVGAGRVSGHLLEAMEKPKVNEAAKSDALAWMAAHVADVPDAKELAKAGGLGLSDKSSQVRAEATALFTALVEHHGGNLHAALKAVPAVHRKACDPVLAKLGLPPPGAGAGAGAGAGSAAAPARSSLAARSKSAAPLSKSVSSLQRGGSARSSAAGAARASTTAVPSMSSSDVRASSAGEPSGPVLLPSSDKETRQKRTRGLKANYEDPRPDMTEELKTLLTPYLRDDLQALMFSTDFKKHTQAADILLGGMTQDMDAVVSNLDLVLRWAVLRLVEANTTSLLKTLELLASLLEELKEAGYRLTEVEALLLLPTLLDRSGHNMAQVREKYRHIVRLVCGVYPVSKLLVTFFTEAFGSKNFRSRMEVLEETAALIERHGVDTTKGFKVLPAVAELVGSRDAGLRQTALNTLAACYRLVGDEIWKFLGKTAHDSKLKQAMDEKFKWVVKQMERAGEGRPGENYWPLHATPATSGLNSPSGRASPKRPASAAAPAAAQDAVLGGGGGGATAPRGAAASPPSHLQLLNTGADALPAPEPSQYSPTPAATHSALPDSAGEPATPLPERPEGLQDSRLSSSITAAPTPMIGANPNPFAARASAAVAGSAGERTAEDVSEMWIHALHQIGSADEAASVDGMKQCCTELANAAAGRADPATNALFVADADNLVSLLTAKSQTVFAAALALMGASDGLPSSRACKYVLNTLMQAFQLPVMARAVAEPTLRNLTGELLCRLLDDRVPRLEEGTALLKALNILMLKILENSRRNYAFSCLLQVLRVPPPQLEHGNMKSKFCDLVIKCLIKLTKALGASLGELDLDALLFSIHQFFMGLGVDEIRRRGQEDDKPLRMVKTVLHELCKLKGPAVRQHLTLIPPPRDAGEPQPIIHAYIDLNLQSLSATGAPGGGGGSQPGTPSNLGRQLRASSSGLGRSQDLRTSALINSAAQSAALELLPPAPASPGSGGATMDLKQELAGIFKKIGDKDSTSVGLEELFHFTRDHPDIDITPHLSKTSEAFRIYIKRGLEKVEEQYRNGGVGGYSSQGPLSPILRRPLGEQGAAAVGPPAGTTGEGIRTSTNSSLDAIKERMDRINLSVRSSAAGGGIGGAATALRQSAPAAEAAEGVGTAAEAVAAPARKPTATMSMAELKERMARLQQAAPLRQ